ncbi:MAG: rRNA adenine N-6-methyltransferase family protein [Nanoarchaeota archaeon]
MSRAPKKDIIYQEKLKVPKEFIRFATPRDVSLYRAERLGAKTIVEIGAGIGGQTIAFAKNSKKTIAVELNRNRVSLLADNLKKLKIKNVEIITGDALNKSIINKIKREEPRVIFVDTERPEQSDRTLNFINPPIQKILEAYLQITKKIAIEIPPFTQGLETIKKDNDFEAEFISLDNQLNRLTLYFNELKKCEVSAIALPSREKIIMSDKHIQAKTEKFAKKYNYLYLIDPTIVVAHLLEELSVKFDAPILNLSKPVLLSNEVINSHFLTKFKIVKTCENDSNQILKTMNSLGIGKVTLRYNLEPNEYWKVRNSYEKRLTGKREINLFINEKQNEAILAEKA